MGKAGEYNIGQLCREAFGSDSVSIGFGTDHGEVVTADDWGGAARIKDIVPSRAGSWEQIFLRAGRARSLTEWSSKPALASALAGVRLERAIGVIYRPDTELRSHYFDARLSRQFDAFVWFEATSPVTPLSGAPAEGAPDIYPFGL